MHIRAWIGLIFVLFLIIVGLLIALFAIPGPTNTATGTPTTTPTGTVTGTATGQNTQPLSARVTVTTPRPNATVDKMFIIAGSAPGPWFFEASFPIKVIDKNGSVILNTYATAQGDWMTTDLVTFTATASTTGYVGPATLVLLRDNPSGMPENDDSVEIPIVIQ